MGTVRLRTKFLIAMLLTSASLTAVTLFVVQRTVDHRARQGIVADLETQSKTSARNRPSAKVTCAPLRNYSPTFQSSKPS